MKRHMFCIRCGREAVEGGVLCAECISIRRPSSSLPPVMHFHICPSCGRIREGKDWLSAEEMRQSMIREIRKSIQLEGGVVLRELEVGELPVEGAEDIEVSISVLDGGTIRHETLFSRVSIDGDMCPSCSRRSGHYYESTIQLRTEGRAREGLLEEAAQFLKELCELYEKERPDFFISALRRTQGGFDFQLSSSTAAFSIAREAAQHLGCSIVSTRKLYGRRGGKEVYRTTYLLRIMPYRKGDSVEYNGRHFKVEKTRPLTLVPLNGGKAVFVDLDHIHLLKYTVSGEE